jgi:uncharacterized membrane protein
MVLFALGVVCIVDITRRLKYWDSLNTKRTAKNIYHQYFGISAIISYTLSHAFGGIAILSIFVLLYLEKSNSMSYTMAALFFVIIGGLVALTSTFYYRSKQQRAKGSSSVLQKDQRKPIILLRSFADDMIAVRSGSLPLPFYLGDMRGLTFEEVITSELARHGPVVAIGRPGESLPPVGAARDYVANEDWQCRVSSLLPEALAIVVVVGATDGLAWELREIFKVGARGKVLLILPPGKLTADKKELSSRWEAFYKLISHVGEWNLPSEINWTRTLLIDAERCILYEGRRNASGYRAAIDTAIRCLVQRKD